MSHPPSPQNDSNRELQPRRSGILPWILIGMLGLAGHYWSRNRANSASIASPAATTRDGDLDANRNRRPDSIPDSDGEPGRPADHPLRLGVDLIHEASQLGAEVVDSVAGLSVAEEIEAGRKMNVSLLASAKVCEDRAEVARLAELAEPLLAARKRREIEYHFEIIEDESINAFAHLGGYVYVHRGLLRVANPDALRFVLGHEICHCDQRHCAQMVAAEVRAAEIAGDFARPLAGVAARLISLGYSEHYELDCDAWSYHQLRRIGYSHDRAMAGIELLEQQAPAGQDHDPNRPVVIAALADHFASHPPLPLRRTELERLRRE